ncbi:MAG: PEGA domain-containing protein [Candidatus Aminicenantes bacterium]|nr:PEGA domain-containing protein [Candidatus Aminicenantes bacterium]NIM84935.1 PEGA domain-containing protein [Candidatus Aminicenantes bacterium]NIN24449.1 PEGA domain-containing protein [Candidatus Aminicenantes bacterium]NIN48213.1 PEGA domain-containing protein [Candidatus Aminicenantes bacterium]NIN91116.1 PEGA domain-containing protein [Candidatus Aminicenantes bacterium]
MKQIFNVNQGLKLISILTLIIIFSSCTLHFPYEWDWGSRGIRVRLLVEPDDANVLLNGKWIGEAYEFSSFESAIRLASRNNEIIVKKEGYVEEVIDLYQYYTSNITIRLKLLKDKDYTGPVKPKKPGEKPKPKDAGKKPKYPPKAKPPEKIPQDIEEKGQELTAVESVEVFLEVLPEEASIYINGKFWGISPKGGKIENFRLKPGKYTLEVLKPGYRTYEKELIVKDKKINLSIRLEKK